MENKQDPAIYYLEKKNKTYFKYNNPKRLLSKIMEGDLPSQL